MKSCIAVYYPLSPTYHKMLWLSWILSPSLKTCSVFPHIKQRKLSVTWLFLCLAITLFLICLHFFTTSGSGTHFNLASILITPLLLLPITSQFSSVWRIFLSLSHSIFFFLIFETNDHTLTSKISYHRLLGKNFSDCPVISLVNSLVLLCQSLW